MELIINEVVDLDICSHDRHLTERLNFEDFRVVSTNKSIAAQRSLRVQARMVAGLLL